MANDKCKCFLCGEGANLINRNEDENYNKLRLKGIEIISFDCPNCGNYSMDSDYYKINGMICLGHYKNNKNHAENIGVKL